jgi:hypothetical protein
LDGLGKLIVAIGAGQRHRIVQRRQADHLTTDAVFSLKTRFFDAICCILVVSQDDIW